MRVRLYTVQTAASRKNSKKNKSMYLETAAHQHTFASNFAIESGRRSSAEARVCTTKKNTAARRAAVRNADGTAARTAAVRKLLALVALALQELALLVLAHLLAAPFDNASHGILPGRPRNRPGSRRARWVPVRRDGVNRLRGRVRSGTRSRARDGRVRAPACDSAGADAAGSATPAASAPRDGATPG